jgi:hypothetical protein
MALVVNCGLVFWCKLPPLNPVNPPPPPPPPPAAAPPLLPGFSLRLFPKAPRAAVVPEIAKLGLEFTPNPAPAPAAWPIANPAAAAAAWPCGKMDGMGKDEKVLELA